MFSCFETFQHLKATFHTPTEKQTLPSFSDKLKKTYNLLDCTKYWQAHPWIEINNPVIFRASLFIQPCHVGLDEPEICRCLVVPLVQISILGPELCDNTKCCLWQIGVSLPHIWVYHSLCFFCPFSTLYLISQCMKFTCQRVSRAIRLSLALYLWVKPIFIHRTLLTGTFYWWVKRTRPPLPLMNVPAVVFAKSQHSLFVLLRACASLN